LSVCTTSTHDMNPVRAWWEEDRALSQRFYNQVLGAWGEAPYFCEPWLCELVVEQHLKSPAMLTILPWQDWVAMDGKLRRENPNEERINVPANSRHYWRYRMHMTLEELLSANEMNQMIRRKIKESGR
ncbi:MAG: 4-alpha-glucanotransferase, partial [Alistipes sp.]|nr:4-alpha-glucanotransferase [Alistipes sp.]